MTQVNLNGAAVNLGALREHSQNELVDVKKKKKFNKNKPIIRLIIVNILKNFKSNNH